MNRPYWLETPALAGVRTAPKNGEICIIGSGLSGVSAAYWLLESGFSNITIVDNEPEIAASFRNAGHILYGTVESMHAMVALHGKDKAREIWQHSIDICHTVRDTIRRLDIDCDYRQDGYLVMAIDEVEDREIRSSVALLNSMGFPSEYWEKGRIRDMGFRTPAGGRFEAGSAQAHPAKFRNGLLSHVLNRGVAYHSGVNVTRVHEEDGHAVLEFTGGRALFDAAVIAANAYSPLFSDYFSSRRLVEPFRGQIIVSERLPAPLPCQIPHSFDHGYIYALATSDQRLLIGGWRNHAPGGEKGTYELTPNARVERGLKDFAQEHYSIPANLKWDYSWSGIMAASKTGFPFIGATTSPRIFACAGYTGHGFSWAHGSARLLAQIMAGLPTPDVAQYFRL